MTTATYEPVDSPANDAGKCEDLLNRNLFVVKEHVGFFKAASNYDVLDAETGEVIFAMP